MPPAPSALVVLVTCPSVEVGERLGRSLVEEHLAACVNVVPQVTSIYTWGGRLVREAEVLLLVKTCRPRFPALAKRIAALHPYAVPEIVGLPIHAGAPAYLAWLADATRPALVRRVRATRRGLTDRKAKKS